jgi:uncharacterized protein (DUF2267 family)
VSLAGVDTRPVRTEWITMVAPQAALDSGRSRQRLTRMGLNVARDRLALIETLTNSMITPRGLRWQPVEFVSHPQFDFYA